MNHSTVYQGTWLPGPPDSVCVRMSEGARASTAIRDLCRLDRRTSHAGSWMKNGLVLGAMSGAVFSAGALAGTSEDFGAGEAALFFLLFMSAGAGAGALVGGMIGALVPEWEPVTEEAIGATDPPN